MHKAAPHTLSHGSGSQFSEAPTHSPGAPTTEIQGTETGPSVPPQRRGQGQELGLRHCIFQEPFKLWLKMYYYFLYNSSQSSSGAWTQHIRKEWSNENRDTNNSKGELNTEENKLKKYKCVWRQSSGAMPLLEPPRLQSKPWPRTQECHRGPEPHLPVRKAQRVPAIWEHVAPPGQLDIHANYEEHCTNQNR